MTKQRILFVDDDPALLAGLQSVLRRERGRWDMVFANGPEAALTELDGAQFDIVVSDMRMPNMDGAKLLDRVRALQPAAVRIILSGSSDGDEVARALAASNEVIEKPCPAKHLKTTLERWLANR